MPAKCAPSLENHSYGDVHRGVAENGFCRPGTALLEGAESRHAHTLALYVRMIEHPEAIAN